MSTLKATNLQHGSATVTNLVLAADGSVTGGIPAGGRNKIINGSFAIDQRNAGASQTITAGAALAYTVDRWYAYCTGANVTGQRVAGSAPFQYNYKFTGAASNTAVGFGTRLEAADTFFLAGSTATLSVYAASSSITTLTWTAYYATTADTFGTLASPTRTQIATGTFTINSTLSRYSAQISMSASATTGVEIVFTTGALTATNTLTFAGAQLESGSAPTAFEFKPVGVELRECQRYYYLHVSGASKIIGNAALYSATNAQSVIHFPVSMRTAPNLVASSGTNYYDMARNGATDAFNSLSIALAQENAAIVNNTTEISGTAGQAGDFRTANAAASVAFSAEL